MSESHLSKIKQARVQISELLNNAMLAQNLPAMSDISAVFDALMIAHSEEPNAITIIEKQTTGIHEKLPPNEVLAAYDKILFYAREVKRVKDLVELQALEWIKANGDLDTGNGIRYYAGIDKVTKCSDIPRTLEAVLEVVGGDFNAFCEVLSSNAVKHGAAKKLLPPAEYEKFFTVEVKDELKEGKSKLMKADARYVK